MTIRIIDDTACPTCHRPAGRRCVIRHRDGREPTIRLYPHVARRLAFRIENAGRPASQ